LFVLNEEWGGLLGMLVGGIKGNRTMRSRRKGKCRVHRRTGSLVAGGYKGPGGGGSGVAGNRLIPCIVYCKKWLGGRNVLDQKGPVKTRFTVDRRHMGSYEFRDTKRLPSGELKPLGRGHMSADEGSTIGMVWLARRRP